jgi:predicted MFS family arabinose efflux permease
MSETALKRFVNELAGKVVLIVMGIAFMMNSPIFGKIVDDQNLSELIEVNTRLLGLVLIIFGALNITTSYYLAVVEKEEISEVKTEE